ncbi:hypothetical protein FPRO03_04460 [Fusarium proliferatum]|nr:hypothetical protein FPRO03_04460 [Fusarium proliferatum]
MCLCVYENVVFSQPTAWLLHYDGLGRLMQARGPKPWRTPAERQILQAARYYITLSAGHQRRHCFLDQPQWESTRCLPEGETPDKIDILYDIFAQPPGIIADYDNIRKASVTDPAAVEVLRNRTQLLIDKLYKWYRDMPWVCTTDPVTRGNSGIPLPDDPMECVALAISYAMLLCLVQPCEYLDIPLFPENNMEATSNIDQNSKNKFLALEICRFANWALRGQASASYALLEEDLRNVRVIMNSVVADSYGFELGRMRHWDETSLDEGRKCEISKHAALLIAPKQHRRMWLYRQTWHDPCNVVNLPPPLRGDAQHIKRSALGYTTPQKRSTKQTISFGNMEGLAQQPNPSTIQRINQLVHDGLVESNGVSVAQIPKYYVAPSNVVKLSDMFRSRNTTSDDSTNLIKTIVRDICLTLERPEDELWLYGSGHGAFIARAVAGIVHRMGLPTTQSFDDLFDTTLGLIKAQLEDDFKRGPVLLQKIKSEAQDPPRIPFVGLFDTIIHNSKTSFDISFNPSIETLRQALAINENKSNKTPEVVNIPDDADMTHRSLTQAWFLGTHEDMIGGTAHDGLSLYPLQWMVLESIYSGLRVNNMGDSKASDNPMALIFPQYAGNLPPLHGSEEIEWRLQYTNGLRTSMFDLQSMHAKKSAGGVETHSIKLDTDCYKHAANRKVFAADGSLKGWCDVGPYGNMIHPSLFCILDRYPRYNDLKNFQPLKKPISDFQDSYFVATEDGLAPWLQGMQLEASGVKAFRILVCGKTGVGKSTLINKVFGVEMTDESLSYDQGVHDINVAFESPKHPGLLIHDSRGWQAGSDTELDLIAKFLRHRAFQEDPAEALHVIWFCVDADVARIEEADKRTFATIAQYSHQVPVFVVGTKKDKLTGYRKMQYLEELMEKTDDYREAKRLAEEKANAVAEEQFAELRNQLSQIEHYKADGFCCLSKNDDAGVKDLLSQTLGLIVDERVRLFCVAAQVVDVEQKINSAITECMRLGTHAIRTAAVPLPCTGLVGTPTVSRLICEHVLQCFGFPKAAPAEIEQIMSDIVMSNFKQYLRVSLSQFAAVSAISIGAAVPTMGIGFIVGAAGCLLGLPPTARMLLKCSCDMILILERSFRYDGKYVSIKQIEDAAKYYSKTTITTFNGKEKRLQQQVHDELDHLIPLKKVNIGFKFNKLRSSVEEIIYSNRFGNPPDYTSLRSPSSVGLDLQPGGPVEMDAAPTISELPGDEVDYSQLSKSDEKSDQLPLLELDSTEVGAKEGHVSMASNTSGTTAQIGPSLANKLVELHVQPPELEGNAPGEVTDVRQDSLEVPPLATRSKSDSSGSKWSNKLSSWKLSRKSKTLKQ